MLLTTGYKIALVTSSKRKIVPPCGPIVYNTWLIHWWPYSGPVRTIKEKQKLCTLIFSCLHDIIFVLLHVMQIGPQITDVYQQYFFFLFSHTQVKLWSPAVLNANTHVYGLENSDRSYITNTQRTKHNSLSKRTTKMTHKKHKITSPLHTVV